MLLLPLTERFFSGYVSVGIRTKVLCYVDHFQKCGSATQPKEREHYLYTTKIAYNFLIMNLPKNVNVTI